MAVTLVTGGAGFIGSHIAEVLLHQGHQVIVLDDLSGGSVDNVPPGATLEVGTILDEGKIEALFRRYRNVIGIFMNQIMRGEPMTIFGDGTQTRAFSYINDVAPVVAHAIEVPAAYNEVFNIGADTPYAVNELALRTAEAMGAEPVIVYLPARNEVQHAYSLHEKAHRILGEPGLTPLQDGLLRMATWAKAVGPRTSRPFDTIEIPKNLPLSWQQ